MYLKFQGVQYFEKTGVGGVVLKKGERGGGAGLGLVSGVVGGKLIGGRVCPAQHTPITSITDTSHFTLKPPSFSKWGTTSNALCVKLTLEPNQSDPFITLTPCQNLVSFPRCQ